MKKFLAGILIATSSLMFTACDSDRAGRDEQNFHEDVEDTKNAGHETAGVAIQKSKVKLDFDSLNSYARQFKQLEYRDSKTDLTIKYNLFIPEGYLSMKSYPLVVFIADASCVGEDPTRSLTQGRGALVWASKEWQEEHECIVAVPTYSTTVIDDRDEFHESEYVELTHRFIESLTKQYSIDKNRIYGTGQSMGCMTTMLLASKHPDLFAATMLVDGQWDTQALKGLESQRFIYFAAEDDSPAFRGMQEVMEMFDRDWIEYGRAQWDGNFSSEELADSAINLFSMNRDANFVSWKTGTIQPKGRGGASFHMASFDYAYGSVDAMEWIFNQRK